MEEIAIMKRCLTTHRRAVTLVELLVVLAILSLLATLAVPVYVQKTEQARRATARAEVRAIAEAQEQVALAHGFYVPMHLLDNLANSTFESAVRDDFDNYGSASPGAAFLINPFVNLQQQFGNQPTLADGLSGNDLQAANMIAGWQGPFLNPTRVGNDAQNPNTRQNVARDIILDPWGRPYVFFSPVGIIAEQNFTDLKGYDTSDTSVSRIAIDSGRLRNQDGSFMDPFDRWAIVSYGANGVLDANDAGPGGVLPDDIWYTFGFVLNETAFNAL